MELVYFMLACIICFMLGMDQGTRRRSKHAALAEALDRASSRLDGAVRYYADAVTGRLPLPEHMLEEPEPEPDKVDVNFQEWHDLRAWESEEEADDVAACWEIVRGRRGGDVSRARSKVSEYGVMLPGVLGEF